MLFSSQFTLDIDKTMILTAGLCDKVNNRRHMTGLGKSCGVRLDVDCILRKRFQVFQLDSYVSIIADVHRHVNGLPAAPIVNFYLFLSAHRFDKFYFHVL